MKSEEIHNYLISKHRAIYQEAELFEQNRKNIESYLDVLADPFIPDQSLTIKNNVIESKNNSYSLKNNVIDFRKKVPDADSAKWTELNTTLVNYQKFLTPYVLLNSLPIYNYIAEKTGLNKLVNARVIDVGAGTGQTYGTFFYHQESIEYFLLDPNLRFIHDQFLRLYPKLTTYPIGHILCYAENLPFKNEVADLVMSLSSVDHFKDYKKFIAEAHRILKPTGQILIASHLDGNTSKTNPIINPPELHKEKNQTRTFAQKLFNRVSLKSEYYAKKYHNKKRGRVPDDHMHHFEDTKVLENALREAGFKVEMAEVFDENFFIKARKLQN
jgi:ubiquinone/menaquinone biosynthesis C-methylase UbiE